MEHFYAIEDRDGVRWSWHMWPASTAEAKKLQVPLAWFASINTPLYLTQFILNYCTFILSLLSGLSPLLTEV
jgi:hypothetical protein